MVIDHRRFAQGVRKIGCVSKQANDDLVWSCLARVICLSRAYGRSRVDLAAKRIRLTHIR